MQLIHGDCLEKMKDIPDGSVDMVLCDLPYGTTACKWDVVIPFEPLWEQYKRIIKDRGAIVLFGSEPFSSHLRMSNLSMFKYDWIWEKPKGSDYLNAKNKPLKNHEIISVFSKGTTANGSKSKLAYFPIMVPGEYYKKTQKNDPRQGYLEKGNRKEWLGTTESNFRYPKSILSFPIVSHDSIHPTQKPVPLLEYLIKTYTSEGETVLDNTMGSGSTGIACLNIKRNFIGIEKDEKYFEIAKKRIEEHRPEFKLFKD